MTLPQRTLRNIWLYDDADCLLLARKLFWEKDAEISLFEVETGESQESFIQRLTKRLLSSPGESLRVKGEKRNGIVYCEHVSEERWFFISFIDFDDKSLNPNSWDYAAAIWTSSDEINQHLTFMVSISLFAPYHE